MPITVQTVLSFSAWGTLTDPVRGPDGCILRPCGDVVWLGVIDNQGNTLIYILQRAADDTPSGNGYDYAEIFLDPELGAYDRGLLADFSTLPHFVAAGAAITSVAFGVQGLGEAFVDDIAITTDTSLGTAHGAHPHASGDASGRITLAFVSSVDRPVMLQRAADGSWSATAIDEESSAVPAALHRRAMLTWVEPSDGRSYLAVATPQGLLSIDTAASPMLVRNLTAESASAGATPITGPSTVFVSNEGAVNIVGVNQSGEVVRYFQTGQGGGATRAWGFMNITTSQLSPNGLPTPVFASNLVSYVSSWGGLHVAGLDPAGDIHAVWWAPGQGHWWVNNLSAELNTPPLLVETGLTAYVTPWGGLNLAGLDESGSIVVRWWAPELGPGNWRNTDLTDTYGGPALASIGLTSFVLPWGALNVSGVTPDGDLVNYWWVPGFDSWLVTSIRDACVDPNAPRLVGSIAGLGAPNGEISIIGASENGDVIRYLWRPGDGADWHCENVSESTTRR